LDRADRPPLGCRPRGAAAGAATLSDGLKRYTPYAVEQIDAARTGAERLLERVAARDAAGAQRA